MLGVGCGVGWPHEADLARPRCNVAHVWLSWEYLCVWYVLGRRRGKTHIFLLYMRLFSHIIIVARRSACC